MRQFGVAFQGWLDTLTPVVRNKERSKIAGACLVPDWTVD
jgi:hypothetical protein